MASINLLTAEMAAVALADIGLSPPSLIEETPSVSYILAENGDFLTTENGDRLILE